MTETYSAVVCLDRTVIIDHTELSALGKGVQIFTKSLGVVPFGAILLGAVASLPKALGNEVENGQKGYWMKSRIGVRAAGDEDGVVFSGTTYRDNGDGDQRLLSGPVELRAEEGGTEVEAFIEAFDSYGPIDLNLASQGSLEVKLHLLVKKTIL